MTDVRQMAYPIVVIALIAVNAAGLTLMGWDKQMAITGGRRIPERVLMTIALCFGALGICGGMYLFRHKTKKAAFRGAAIVLLVLQCIALYGVFRYM